MLIYHLQVWERGRELWLRLQWEENRELRFNQSCEWGLTTVIGELVEVIADCNLTCNALHKWLTLIGSASSLVKTLSDFLYAKEFLINSAKQGSKWNT